MPRPQRTGWRRLAACQTKIAADVVSRLEQGAAAAADKDEDPKARRRRLYRLASEERPKFPQMPRNFYSHVMENKEVVKTLSLLSTCTQEIRVVREAKCQSLECHKNRGLAR